MKKVLFIVCTFVLMSISTLASSINQISLKELQNKADFVVLAQVIDVKKDGNRDHVTIEIDSFLKGKFKKNKVSFNLVTRGGLKDFDPELKKGSCGVFFLKKLEDKEGVQKAYWGSMAMFHSDIFQLSKKSKAEVK